MKIDQPEISQTLYERIESYLLNTMSEQERRKFESEIAENESLKKEVQIQKELLQAVELGALRESLDAIKTKRTTMDDGGSSEPRRYWFAMAAGFAALVALGVWMFMKPNVNAELFAEYAEQDPGLPVPMSTTDQYDFYDAMVDYKNEQYEKAIDKWSLLLAIDPKNDTLNYYLGATYFNRAEYSNALPYFERVNDLESLEFRAKSQWYLTLSWLQTRNYSAIDSLSNVALPPYRERIESINDALKEGL